MIIIFVVQIAVQVEVQKALFLRALLSVNNVYPHNFCD